MLHRSKKARWRAGLAMALSVSALAVAATSASAATPRVAHPSLSNVPLVIGASASGTNFLPAYVATQNGYFAKSGLNVSFQLFSAGDTATFAAFLNGNINVVAGGVSDDIEYIGNGVLNKNSGKFFAELVGNAYDIVTTKNITSLQGIEGHEVGISGPNDGDEIYFEAVLKAYGIPLSSVTFVTAGGTAARLTAISTGTVQAVAESTANRTTSEQVGNVVLAASKSKVAYPNTAFYATKALLKHSTELQKFVQAMGKATTWIKTHEIAATPICVSNTGASSATCQSGILSLVTKSFGGPYTWSKTEAVDSKGIEAAIKTVQGLYPSPSDLKLTASELIDTSIAGTNPNKYVS